MNRRAGIETPLIQADACELPFAARSFDVVFSAYGAIPFVAELDTVFGEAHRLLVPGGLWVFSVTHPIRWAFPDDPGPRGLTADRSYFDRRPYIERDSAGTLVYSEHHRTLGDYLRALRRSGFALEDLIEPEWPESNREIWGGWSPLRGRRIPGTAIFLSRRGQ